VYRTETSQETYTATGLSTRRNSDRTYTVNRMVPECQTCYRTVCVNVPVCEERVCYQTRTCYKPVTKMVRKCVDQGHWECQLVEQKSFCERLGFHKKKCCDPCDPCCCEPVKYKTVKKWVSCKVWVECPVTCREKVCETVPVVKKVHTCRKQLCQEAHGDGVAHPRGQDRVLHGVRAEVRAVHRDPVRDPVRAALRDPHGLQDGAGLRREAGAGLLRPVRGLLQEEILEPLNLRQA
jgi:hypothetical protein